MLNVGFFPIYKNDIAVDGVGNVITTPYSWASNYNQTPAYTDISFEDSEATQRLYTLSSGNSWMPMIGSNISSLNGGSINTYYGPTTPLGDPWVFIPPMSNPFKYASTYWSGRFQELMVQAQRVGTGITKTFVQIAYLIPTTLNGYGFSWHFEANETGLITGAGVIPYRLENGVFTVLGGYAPPLSSNNYTTRVNIWLEIDTVGTGIYYNLRFRKSPQDPWTTLLNTIYENDPYAGFKLVPVIIHSVNPDSASATSITIEAGGNNVTGLEFSNTPGVLT